MKLRLFAIAVCCAFVGTDAAEQSPTSKGIYRLPYNDGTEVKVFDDFESHRPIGRVDLFAVSGATPFLVVAAAPGRVMAIQDKYSARQAGLAASACQNNYVWIAHENGEWTNYSHLAQGSVTGYAKLKVGVIVQAGTLLGIEGSVGCAMLDHVHFEVAVPDKKAPVDAGGFLNDNDDGKRERNPRFCNVPGGTVVKDATYTAAKC
jgi:murein DD-endopeptidase MepM/ murein hydrolase activator NlpD